MTSGFFHRELAKEAIVCPLLLVHPSFFSVGLRLSPHPISLREARARLLRSDPRVKSARGRQPRPSPWPDLNPALRSIASPSSPPPFPNLPTSPPVPPAKPQSCREPIMFKPREQQRDNSQACPAQPATRFFAIPPRNFGAVDSFAIEPKSQPGRKRGNEVNHETGHRSRRAVPKTKSEGEAETRDLDSKHRAHEMRTRKHGTSTSSDRTEIRAVGPHADDRPILFLNVWNLRDDSYRPFPRLHITEARPPLSSSKTLARRRPPNSSSLNPNSSSLFPHSKILVTEFRPRTFLAHKGGL
jgi:hypothetical protein